MIQMAVHEVTHAYVNDCNHWHLLRHRATTTG
jgi:hypothetical protein